MGEPGQTESVESLLKGYCARPGVQGAYLVRRNGVLVASGGSARVPAGLVSAMCSVAYGGLETVFAEVSNDPPQRVHAETKDHRILIEPAWPEFLLVAITTPQSPWEEVRTAAQKLALGLVPVLAS